MEMINRSTSINEAGDEAVPLMVMNKLIIKNKNVYEMVGQLGSRNAVVVFSMSGCCMCTVAKRLLFGLGVGPTVIEVDEHVAGDDIQAVLHELADAANRGNYHRQSILPAVFVGGKFLGGVENLMACHINGSLVPLLKDAGALWL